MYLVPSFHQDQNIALKPPRNTVNNEFDETVLVNTHQSLIKNFQIKYPLDLETCKKQSYIFLQSRRKTLKFTH